MDYSWRERERYRIEQRISEAKTREEYCRATAEYEIEMMLARPGGRFLWFLAINPIGWWLSIMFLLCGWSRIVVWGLAGEVFSSLAMVVGTGLFGGVWWTLNRYFVRADEIR